MRGYGFVTMAAAVALAVPVGAQQAERDAATPTRTAAKDGQLLLSERGYLTRPGLDVIVFDDIYPDGHQTGVTVIQHGLRVAANGDIRLEAEPGQWSPMSKGGERKIDPATGTITQTLSFPDPDKDGKGFNPIFYPDLKLSYKVRVAPEPGGGFRVSVDMDQPVPAEWVGRVGFNFELFPEHLFGRSWVMGDQGGTFPRQPNGPVAASTGPQVPVPRNAQPNGPVQNPNGQILGVPLGIGRSLVVAPESDRQRMIITSETGTIALLDGRSAHNNGWYIARETVKAGATTNAVSWVVRPNTIAGWSYAPVVQVSQVGYAAAQPKRAVIELDARGGATEAQATLYRLTAAGREAVKTGPAANWGNFLRYRYRTFDFSDVTTPGMYVLAYGGTETNAFRIGDDVYSRGVWQPTLETFLPVQMCHMLVREKYRVWHGLDHQDDALMARTDLNHFDGYVQGPQTMTRFAPGEIVPGLNAGGWHDAGDYDLRVESQIGTVWVLAKMVEELGLDYDATRVDAAAKSVEIRDPDGKNDAIQQIEHGLASVLGGYRALGRLYRGVITPDLRSYAMLGDAANHSDNVFRKPVAGLGVDANGKPVDFDDRWVFTEDNPDRELYTAAGLAAAGRVLKRDNPALSAEALAAARAIAANALARAKSVPNKVFALAELAQATGDRAYFTALGDMTDAIVAKPGETAWMLASIRGDLPAAMRSRVDAAVVGYQRTVQASAKTDSPYGIPYVPKIWGAGWDIQERGVQQWFFEKGWPDATDEASWLNALNFVLGAHPGENRASFVSGVGAESALVAYGVNRADWSYIPGGVISGTNLVRPDLPELKTWPYFWQQGEYVMGGGATNFMFLALAADRKYAGAKR
ncbi:cellulase N-terminal Ig-like domain-containing protein [Sphingomonas qomolangmaensis]|uniref:Glycoside hydrolase family 9 protein n=1 Tax=Sphingomonas qomolangmaensis TaxID=2918765 RepID=A0ABY5L5X1_9SPHN|nr:cellulase N-terminal Ig-like domain-containing protein [Sphingomonas qomolangmaensis]UUL82345.1 glycoside hydrolase family 9 protein [Sphingomonas qomolangmaensis]